MEEASGSLDNEALEALVLEHKDRVYGAALSFLGNRQDAEDITQEVFVEVWLSIGKFRGESSLATWIYRITIRKCLDLVKSRRRKKRFAAVVSFFTREGDLAFEPAAFDHPGVTLENKERAEILFDAVARLPEKQRIAYTLSSLEDLSYEKIADVMGTTVSAVESLIFRAKGGLRKMLYDYYTAASL